MHDVLEEITRRTADVVAALGGTDLAAPSQLPGWSRLTIACHLRYGAEALLRMTHEASAGRPASYYPEGRASQRPGTLAPRDGEQPLDVVRSLHEASRLLDDGWRAVDDWSFVVAEPVGNPDLGTVELGRLALARLTEVEVHGTDLGVGLGPWSDTLVRTVLPMRLEWLNTRRSNHREADTSIHRSFLLVATDADVRHVVTVDGETVTSAPGDRADVVIEGTAAELLALLLGRAPAGFAPAEFGRALPGP